MTTPFEANIQLLKDQFPDVVATKIYQWIDEEIIQVLLDNTKIRECDMGNLTPNQERDLLHVLELAVEDSFKDFYRQEDLEWMWKEENVDNLVRLLNQAETRSVFVKDTFAKKPTLCGREFGIKECHIFAGDHIMNVYQILDTLFYREYVDALPRNLALFIAMYTTLLK